MKAFYTLLILMIPFVGVTQSYNGPESVDYDSYGQRYLVSNSGQGQILSYDAINDELDIFASGVVSGPHGLEVVGEELFACSGSRLKAYNLVTEEQTVNVNLGASFANGITHKGNDVFVTDFSGKDIYRYNTVSGNFNMYIENLPITPNGIFYDDIEDRLLVVCWGNNAPIYEIDMTDSSYTTVANTNLGYCDGISMDNNGDFYVSAWSNNAISKFNSDFSGGSTVVVPNMSNPTDIYYNRATDTLAIPNSGNNTVVFVSFIINGCTDINACNFEENANTDDGSCNYPSTSEIIIESCNFIQWNGMILDETGLYSYVTTNSNGCDSTVTLDFNLYNSNFSIDNISSCESYVFNDVEYTESGMYTFEGTNSNGCDSTVIIDLTIYEPISENIIFGNPEPDPFSVSLYSASNNGNNLVWLVDGGNIIENNGSSINIQWGNQGIGLITLVESNDICNDFTNVFTVDIGGQIEPTWDCNANFACIEQSDGSGNFQSLEECEANCSDVVEDSWNCVNDACVDPMDGTGVYNSLNDCEQECQNTSSIDENQFNVSIYPNPSSNIFNLDFYLESETKILVTNILGEQVYIEYANFIGDYNTQIDLSEYSKGIYNLSIRTSSKISSHKLILH